MNKYNIILLVVAFIFLSSCNPYYEEEYENVKTELNSLKDRADDISNHLTKTEIQNILTGIEELQFEYDPTKVRNKNDRASYEELCRDIKDAKKLIPEQLEKAIEGLVLVLVKDEDYLMEGTEAINLHASKGDSIILEMSFENQADVKLYNADSKKLVKSFIGKTQVSDCFRAPNSAIYVVEINPRGSQYADLSVSIAISSLQQYLNYKAVEYELVPCEKNDFRAVAVSAIRTQNIFEEPRKHTLRSGIKSLFSGSDRALIAVEVPYGTSDILYSLRISTSEEARSSDGEFKSNTDLTYHRIKFLGLPIYDSSRGYGIISQILDDNVPYREEEAYCSMYVFYNAAQAKKFQDGKVGISECAYDVTNSRVGTQSCNGRINAKGKSVIYFGFINDRLRYQNYIWFEALASINCTEYYNAKFTLVDPEIN